MWASKYNDRAYVSTRKVGIDFDAVRMAVLCQRVVPAQVRCGCGGAVRFGSVRWAGELLDGWRG